MTSPTPSPETTMAHDPTKPDAAALAAEAAITAVTGMEAAC